MIIKNKFKKISKLCTVLLAGSVLFTSSKIEFSKFSQNKEVLLVHADISDDEDASHSSNDGRYLLQQAKQLAKTMKKNNDPYVLNLAKQLEESMKKSKEKYKKLLNTKPDENDQKDEKNIMKI